MYYNYKEFTQAHPEMNQGLSPYQYAQLVELKLNNALLLLNNPDLMRQLGVNYEAMISEAHNLLSISSIINVPKVVPENDRGRIRTSLGL